MESDGDDDQLPIWRYIVTIVLIFYSFSHFFIFLFSIFCPYFMSTQSDKKIVFHKCVLSFINTYIFFEAINTYIRRCGWIVAREYSKMS